MPGGGRDHAGDGEHHRGAHQAGEEAGRPEPDRPARPPCSSSAGRFAGVAPSGGCEACSSSVVTAQESRPGSSVSAPIVGTPATGAAPSRAISTARMPELARAHHVVVERVAHVQRLLGSGPGQGQRGPEDLGRRLRGSDHCGRHHAVEQRSQPCPLEHLRQRRVPVAGHHQAQPAGAQLLESRGGVGEGVEVERRQQRLAHLSQLDVWQLERVAQHRRAAVAQGGQRGGIAALQVVREVVGDLGRESACRALLAHLDARHPSQLRAQARGGRLHAHERSEGVNRERGDQRWSVRRVSKIASRVMPAVDLPTGSSFVNAHAKELTALASVIVAVVLAKLVDRALSAPQRQARPIGHGAGAVSGRGHPPAAHSAPHLRHDHRDRRRVRAASVRGGQARGRRRCSRRRRCSA